ncbi:MAG: anti-sigma factor antagonist [Pseudonocardiales bacterium]|nr:anti-sigma factor antagonist [Pseudonocardiales bacterium]
MTATPLAGVTHDGNECIVTLTGEMDIVIAPHLVSLVENAVQQCPDGSTSVVLDLAGVTFIDSMGIGALLSAQQCAASRGWSMKLRAVRPRIVRLFTITGLDGAFEII